LPSTVYSSRLRDARPTPQGGGTPVNTFGKV